jgi:ubiquinone/menaquinone biosynthesis C-methylase UbiE
VDIKPFPGVDVVMNIAKDRWPWPDNSVDEVVASHVLEHLTPDTGVDPGGRRHFMNELYRVLKPNPVGKVDYKATVITPHWASNRAYGDPSHVWPPISEMTFLYYNEAWRKVNAPHLDGYACDFEVMQPTYSIHPALHTRSVEHQQERLGWAKEACQDTIQTLFKREKAP